MPGGDGTGPRGCGPRSGRARGFCSGAGFLGFANPRMLGSGRGFGFGRRIGYCLGRRRGPLRRGFYPGMFLESSILNQDKPTEIEKTYLEDLIKDLELELTEAKKRIQELSDNDEH